MPRFFVMDAAQERVYAIVDGTNTGTVVDRIRSHAIEGLPADLKEYSVIQVAETCYVCSSVLPSNLSGGGQSTDSVHVAMRRAAVAKANSVTPGVSMSVVAPDKDVIVEKPRRGRPPKQA